MPRQAGFSILSALLLVISLAAGLVFLLLGAGPNVSGQIHAQKTAQLVAQAQLIVHRISKCATDYPAGDNGTGLHLPYPAGTGKPVVDLTCPNSATPSDWPNLWSGVDGVYAPAPITGFGAWTYTNASPAIVFISSTQPGGYSTAIATAASQIGPAATFSADTLTVKVIE